MTDNRADNFDYAIQCAYWLIRHMRAHLNSIDQDSPDGIVCFMAIRDTQKMLDYLDPPAGEWPNGEIVGKVIPFIPKQRA